MLPRGDIITSGAMVSSNLLPKDGAGNYSDSDADKLINKKYLFYKVEQLGDSNEVFEIELANVKLRLERYPFLRVQGKKYFAATSEAEWSYAGVLIFNEESKYEYLREVQLLNKDPQFQITYRVNPVELLQYQVNAEKRYKPLVLFQRFVCAPSVVVDHKLKEAKASATFKILFNGAGATVAEEATDLGGRFVFRRYNKPETVESLIEDDTDMFEVTTTASGLSHGQNGVQPDHLRFKIGNNVYRLSDRYRKHLIAEGVLFDCPANPTLTPPKAAPKRKVTKHPIKIPKIKLPKF
jgi:hypothetical protein